MESYPSLPSSQNSLSLSLVIPTYQEAGNIEPLLKKVVSSLDLLLPGDYEIIVVDDESSDGTAEIVQELAKNNPSIRLIQRVGKRGLASAVLDGWRASRGRYLGVMDADFQHPPDVLECLWEKIKQDGSQLCIANRFLPGMKHHASLRRRVLSRAGRIFCSWILTGSLKNIKDPLSGYFILERTLIESVILDPVGYKILLEVLVRSRPLRVSEVGYFFCERKKGRSKIGIENLLNFIRHLCRLSLFRVKDTSRQTKDGR